MNIRSATFIQGIVGTHEILEGDTPQIAFIGRSNAGKSSVINSLTGQKKLARTSSFPGRTQEINLFMINKRIYFLDLPGYGYAKLSKTDREWLQKLTDWYLFNSGYDHKKIVLIIDANVGPTDKDLAMIKRLEEAEKDIIIVANKIDKIRKANYIKQLKKIHAEVGEHTLVPFSSKERIGVQHLLTEIFKWKD